MTLKDPCQPHYPRLHGSNNSFFNTISHINSSKHVCAIVTWWKIALHCDTSRLMPQNDTLLSWVFYSICKAEVTELQVRQHILDDQMTVTDDWWASIRIIRNITSYTTEPLPNSLHTPVQLSKTTSFMNFITGITSIPHLALEVVELLPLAPCVQWLVVGLALVEEAVYVVAGLLWNISI